MPHWVLFVVIAALFLGLKDSLTPRQRYGGVCIAVLVAVLYAAYHQHTY